MSMRTATVREGDVALTLNLDGEGVAKASSGFEAFDRMLALFAVHAKFDVSLETGPGRELPAHIVGIVGHCLGRALAEALGDKRGIVRYASALIPIETTLVQVALDLSGRPHLEWSASIPASPEPDGMDVHPALGFMRRLVLSGGINMHLTVLEPGEPIHAFDAIFIAVGRALGEAVSQDAREKGIPSSKGVL